MLKMVDKEYIRKKHFIEGWSIRRISRQLGYSRQTVRKCLKDATIPRYTLTKPRPAPVMGKWLPVIERWLKEDEERPAKQRHTAKRIYDRLVEEYGDEFTGAESTVRRAVRQIRGRMKAPEVFVPLAAKPGELAQVDFQESIVMMNGVPTKAYLFCLTLRYSGVRFVQAFPHARMEDFLEGHVRAFEWLGGVPARIRYDNPKVAVKEFLPGNQRRETDQLLSLQAHYLFEAEFCNPRKAHEKGSAENLCGYVRRNAMVPPPKAEGFEDLNHYLLGWCDRDLAKHPGWEAEKAALRPLPKARFKACSTRLAVVSKQALVTCDRNRYSVPARLVGQTVRLDVYSGHIEIYSKDQLVASHKRLSGRGGLATDFRHYLDVVTVKRRASLDAAFVTEMPAVYQAAQERLKRQDRGYLEFAAILTLNHEFAPDEVEAALAQALAMPEGRLTAEIVRQLILASLRPEPVTVAVPPAIAVKLKAPDLSLYDQLAKAVTSI